MTASEAREAARWHRDESAYFTRLAKLSDRDRDAQSWRDSAANHDRAAVALDAYADGIAAAAVEREACAAMIEAAAQRNAASAVGFPGASSEPWWTTRANALKSAAQAIRERGAK